MNKHLYLCHPLVLSSHALVYGIVSLCILIIVSTLTEVFLCFFLSCKANARANLAKT